MSRSGSSQLAQSQHIAAVDLKCQEPWRALVAAQSTAQSAGIRPLLEVFFWMAGLKKRRHCVAMIQPRCHVCCENDAWWPWQSARRKREKTAGVKPLVSHIFVWHRWSQQNGFPLASRNLGSCWSMPKSFEIVKSIPPCGCVYGFHLYSLPFNVQALHWPRLPFIAQTQVACQMVTCLSPYCHDLRFENETSAHVFHISPIRN